MNTPVKNKLRKLYKLSQCDIPSTNSENDIGMLITNIINAIGDIPTAEIILTHKNGNTICLPLKQDNGSQLTQQQCITSLCSVLESNYVIDAQYTDEMGNVWHYR